MREVFQKSNGFIDEINNFQLLFGVPFITCILFLWAEKLMYRRIMKAGKNKDFGIY